jgi:hypothetical protein
MYIKVISVPELFKGIVTIVIIAFERAAQCRCGLQLAAQSEKREGVGDSGKLRTNSYVNLGILRRNR